MKRAVLPMVFMLSAISQIALAQNERGNWVISETTSPVDYSPQVAATILSRLDQGNGPTSLSVYCRRGRTEITATFDDFARYPVGTEMEVLTLINERDASRRPPAEQNWTRQRWIQQRWDDTDRETTISLKGDVTAFLRSLPGDGRMFVRVFDKQRISHDAEFQLTGLPAVRDKVAAACRWPGR